MSFNSFIKPPVLQKGDTIGVVAPASSFDPENFKQGIKKLRSLGFKVKYERSIFSKYWSHPGNDDKRAHQINRMFADQKVKAIFCAKGGYGSIDIVPHLDQECIRANPKIFVGYSDITFLLLYLLKTASMVVFHGPVISGEIFEGMNPLTIEYMKRALTQTVPIGAMHIPAAKILKNGSASGHLVGGNISMIAESISTPFELDTDDSILFLEDINENLETITQYFKQMEQAGKFAKIKGIIFGKMVDCFDRAGKRYSIAEILTQLTKDYPVPIVYGLSSGHTKDILDLHVTLPLGVEAILDADNQSLIIPEAGVS
jgi:muramoyltetrapeptide carboxypeptidase